MRRRKKKRLKKSLLPLAIKMKELLTSIQEKNRRKPLHETVGEVVINKGDIGKATKSWLYERNSDRKRKLLVVILLNSKSVKEVAQELSMRRHEVIAALDILKEL